uniref:Putative tick salivary peptide group 1 n=1 Tax=Ixodes ricinus TaxID=34613 RepID=A0A090X8T9_IXORI
MMGLTGTTLVLVSFAFIGSVAAHNCQNGTRPASEQTREGCDYYCWNTDTKSWDQIFLRKTVNDAFTANGDNGSIVKNGEIANLNSESGVPTDTDVRKLRTTH